MCGVPVPFILFEGQLCLSLHMEVLSFWDSQWSLGRYKMESLVDKLPFKEPGSSLPFLHKPAIGPYLEQGPTYL